jgi:hypothetical protein
MEPIERQLSALRGAQAALESQLAELRRAQVAATEELHYMSRFVVPPRLRSEMAYFLPLAFALVGRGSWSIASLRAEAARSQHASALRDYINGWSNGGGELKAFGRALAQCRGLSIAPLRLVGVADEGRDGAIYAIRSPM